MASSSSTWGWVVDAFGTGDSGVSLPPLYHYNFGILNKLQDAQAEKLKVIQVYKINKLPDWQDDLMTWWQDSWSMILCLLSYVCTCRLYCLKSKTLPTHWLTRVKSGDASASKKQSTALFNNFKGQWCLWVQAPYGAVQPVTADLARASCCYGP